VRILKINNELVDIDERTAIGITFQSYDVKSPGKRFVNVSNTFSIPATNKNLTIFGNPQDGQTLSTIVYQKATCDYWVDNEQFLKSATVRVEEVQERISLFIYEKADIWDTLKKVEWATFVSGLVSWLQTTKGLPSVGTPYVGSSQTFVETYANSTEGVFLPMYVGNLFDYDPLGGTAYVEDFDDIFLYHGFAMGGHFCVYVKTIFEYIEFAYDVNFLTSGGVLNGNIWDDPVAQVMYTPLRTIDLFVSDLGGGNVSAFFSAATTLQIFSPLKGQRDKDDKTPYGLVNSFMQIFNILKDDIVVSGEDVIRLARFDDIETLAEVVDFSDRLTGKPKFRPFISGYGQNNYIRYSEIFPEGSPDVNSKVLTSSNENLDVNVDLFDIDAYISSVFDNGVTSNGDILDLTVTESFKTFQFMVSDGLTTNNVGVKIKNIGIAELTLATLKLQRAAIYELDSEYNFLDEIITYPRFYEQEKWLNLNDIKDLQFFKQYYIKELGGSFFINKISGFNPDKSNKATKIELIKLGNRTPIPDPDLDYWTDGVADAWTDGENQDYWY
jgi:hypothetical protein